jgi:hypothetical protein
MGAYDIAFLVPWKTTCNAIEKKQVHAPASAASAVRHRKE